MIHSSVLGSRYCSCTRLTHDSGSSSLVFAGSVRLHAAQSFYCSDCLTPSSLSSFATGQELPGTYYCQPWWSWWFWVEQVLSLGTVFQQLFGKEYDIVGFDPRLVPLPFYSPRRIIILAETSTTAASVGRPLLHPWLHVHERAVHVFHQGPG
jgi:hypothetical protein